MWLIILFLLLSPLKIQAMGVAVEFMDHASSAFVARDKGWFKKEGLNVSTYNTYVTGMALAASLSRGDINVAYMCLVPAINAYANAGVKIKIVSGTHKYGYGLVVDPEKVKDVRDLEEKNVRIGCVREGGAADLLLQKVIDKFRLDRRRILKKVLRMSPPKQLLAIKMGKLDAAFLPEQWATMAEELGFKMLIGAEDVWPMMQGSVLVVKEEFLKKHRDEVYKIVKVTKKATDWINEHPREAASIVAKELNLFGKNMFPEEHPLIRVDDRVILKSMNRMAFTVDLDPNGIQMVIDYLYKLGYLRRWVDASEILDLSFLKGIN